MGLDRRERSGELIEGMLVAQEGHQARIWTAMPGIIQSFDPVKRTCVIQPATQGLFSKSDGTQEWVNLPLLMDCPVQFPQGGGVVLTFPLAAGDECLVVFASRCIDAWWQNGGIMPQAELRMHDLSDGFCIPGVRSVPNVEGAISTTEAQLRSVDGTTRVRLDPAAHTVIVDTTGAVVTVKPSEIDLVTGPTSVTVTPAGATLASTAASIAVSPGLVNVTGQLIINGTQFLNHHHSGVTTGTGVSGGVV